jgi:hypothetical protein
MDDIKIIKFAVVNTTVQYCIIQTTYIMIKTQRDQFDMLLGIEHHFNTSTAAWTSNTLLSSLKTKLSNDIKTLWGLQGIAISNNKGYAMDKADKRKALGLQCLTISVRLQAYFAVLQNEEQLHSVYLTASKIKECKDAELLGTCHTLHTIVSTEINNLTPYQITPAVNATFMQAIQDFDAVIHAPAEIKITRVASNKKIKLLLKDTLQFVKKVLDKVVATIADTEDHFVKLYRIMRQINGSPTHRRSLFTTCVDNASGAIITNAKLQIAASKKTRISGAKGQNYFQNLLEGEHVLVVSSAGCITQDVTVVVVANLMTKVVVRMVRE